MSRQSELAQLGRVFDSGPLSNRNLIINGAMVIDQRSEGSFTTAGTGTYTIDRWRAFDTTDGVFTVQRVADAPAGFINSAKITVTTAAGSISTSHQAKFQQRIEGYTAARLALGTSSAKTFTLSFWVKSSVTGTYSVGFINYNNNRSYVDTYTISSANTWEYKTITLTGDTTGTWRVDNITGLNIQWSMGMGSQWQATTGSWQAGEYSHTSGAVNLISTLNATWQITGVQLEVGDTATPFEHRNYAQELASCYRYYYKHADHSWFNANANIGIGFYYSSTDIMTVVAFPVSMRTQPSLVQSSGTNYYALQRNGTTDGFNDFTLSTTTYNTAKLFVSSNVSGTAGQAGQLQTEANGNIAFDAEL